jgi:hypothetical protein
MSAGGGDVVEPRGRNPLYEVAFHGEQAAVVRTGHQLLAEPLGRREVAVRQRRHGLGADQRRGRVDPELPRRLQPAGQDRLQPRRRIAVRRGQRTGQSGEQRQL